LGSIEGSFLPWSADLARNLLSLYPLPEGTTPIPEDVLLPPKHHLVLSGAPVGDVALKNGHADDIMSILALDVAVSLVS